MLNQETMTDTLTRLTRWLVSLQAAKNERKREVAAALRQALIAVGDTEKYLAGLAAPAAVDSRVEARLAREWTKLSHLFGNIGNAGLSRRCQVKGGLWPDAGALPAEYREKMSSELSAVRGLVELAVGELEQLPPPPPAAPPKPAKPRLRRRAAGSREK